MSLQRLMKVFSPLLLLIFSIGCTKIKNTDIGVDLLPEIDNIKTFDTTLSVSVQGDFTSDSLLPRVSRDVYGEVGDFVLGQLSNDPVFGATTASIFCEMKPSEYPFQFQNVPDSLYLDSVVLTLKYRSTYGDTNGVQGVDVYRVTDFIRPDTAYPLSASVPYGELLGSTRFAPSVLNDSLYLGTFNTKDQLRIPLKAVFGRSLISFDTGFAKGPLKSDSLFRNYLKGFAIIPQKLSSSNALMTFAMDDTTTHLRFYYRYVKNGDLDTAYKTFSFKNLKPGGAINQIKRSYENSEVRNIINNKLSDSLVYIHSTPGTFAKISMKAVDAFKQRKGNVIVHLAELSMQEVLTAGKRGEIFPAPTYLYIEGIDSSAKSFVPFIADGFPGGTYDPTFFGGMRKTTLDPKNRTVSRYAMNITRYIQGILTRNNTNYPLKLHSPYVVSYSSSVTSFYLNPLCRGGVVLGGGSHPTQPMKLRLVYSKL